MAEERPNPAPPVVFWYRIYCAGMTVLYLAVIVLFAVMLVMQPGWLDMGELPNGFFLGYMVLVFTLCGSLALVFLMALFLKNRPWTWIYHLILISVGLTSPCTLPACIPLLIYWIKPETRVYFGRV